MEVPSYGAPQVRATGLPAARLENPVTPLVAGGAAAEQMGQMGKGMAAAADTLFIAQAKLEAQRDADMASRAEADLRTKYLDFHKQARERRGADAYGLTADAQKWFDDNVGEVDKGLENDRQRRTFGQLVQRFRLSAVSSLSDYEGEQRTRSAIESQGARIETARETAAIDPLNTGAQLDARKVIEGGVKDLARLNGWTPEIAAKARADELSKLHDGVARAMVAQGKFKDATDYLAANLAEITDPKQREALQSYVRNATDDQLGDDTAGAVWAKHGPKADGAPVEMDRLMAALREDPALKDNPTARKSARAKLLEYASDHNSAQQERQAGNVSAVYKEINSGAPLSAVRKSDAWRALPGDLQDKIEYQQEQRAATRAAHAASEAARGAANAQRQLTDLKRRNEMALLTNGAEFLRLSNPEILAGMSRTQVEATQVMFGFEGTQQLLRIKDQVDKEGGKAEAKVDDGLFAKYADLAGFDPYEKKGKQSEGDKARLGSLKSYVLDQIEVEQKRLKRAMTRDEKASLMQRVIDDRVLIDEWGRDPTVPAAGLTKDTAPKAYVEVDGQRVFLKDIPADERAAIVSKRKARGLPVNEQAIARAWVQSNKAD